MLSLYRVDIGILQQVCNDLQMPLKDQLDAMMQNWGQPKLLGIQVMRTRHDRRQNPDFRCG